MQVLKLKGYQKLWTNSLKGSSIAALSMPEYIKGPLLRIPKDACFEWLLWIWWLKSVTR